ncbi:hypothetical protein [Cellulophaga sp. L1A9]|nr:hypothetical protein [Cellulophaga sp. L1A9]
MGETPNLKNRLEQHQNHYFPKGFTKIAEYCTVVL